MGCSGFTACLVVPKCAESVFVLGRIFYTFVGSISLLLLSLLLLAQHVAAASKYMDMHTHTHPHPETSISIDIHIMLVIFALSLLPRVGAGTEGQRQGAWHGAADDRRRVTPQVSLGLRLCISSRVQNVYFVVLRLVACSFCVLSQQRLFAISCTGPVCVCVCV